MSRRYLDRGVSSKKEDVHNAIKNQDKGLFNNTFFAKNVFIAQNIHLGLHLTKTNFAVVAKFMQKKISLIGMKGLKN